MELERVVLCCCLLVCRIQRSIVRYIGQREIGPWEAEKGCGSGGQRATDHCSDGVPQENSSPVSRQADVYSLRLEQRESKSKLDLVSEREVIDFVPWVRGNYGNFVECLEHTSKRVPDVCLNLTSLVRI
jgi:hypothetical protein